MNGLKLFAQINERINRNYGNPKAIVGWYIAEKMVRQHQSETRWTIELLKHSPDAKVLELGCGSGFACKLLLNQSKFTEYVGIDISPTSILTATLRNKKAIQRGVVQFIQCNVKELPFDDECFNEVFSIQSIYFWDNIPKVISEIHRVLKKGGHLVVTLSNGKDGEGWETVEDLLDKQVLPSMKQYGFSEIQKLIGPDSRGYHTLTVVGIKR